MPKQVSYTLPDPDERQPLIAEYHAAQDTANIEYSLEWLGETSAGQPYTVLDIGCEYGAGTQQRFGSDGRFKVTSVDADADAIEYAKEHYSSPNTTYERVDFDALDSISATSYDIVFASCLFEELDEPDSTLDTLWDLVSDPGVLLVREFEDAQHLHYPDDEDMNVTITATGNMPYASSRQYGRQLYTRMTQYLSPTPVKVDMDLETYHTAGKSSEERERYWTVYHANRIKAVLERAEQDDAPDATIELANYLERAMTRAEEKFQTRDGFLDAVTVPVATAFKHSDADSTDDDESR